MRPWHQAIQSHEGAEEDFKVDLGKLREQAQAEQDKATEAGELVKAGTALGAKKLLDSLLSSLQRSLTEERNHARYRRDSGPTAA